MIAIRTSDARGHAQHGWLDTRHTFSFADYYDPAFMGFRDLRVINEDRVEARQGFGTHGHRDMEIISYVLEGALAHKDSLGTGSIVRPGEVQRMSAGTGILHSEFNPSKDEPLHFLQIWIVPARRGLTPSYEQKSFPYEEKRGRLRLVASPDGADGSLTIHQDARLHVAILGHGETVSHRLAPGRAAYVQVARGAARVNGGLLSAGDGAAVEGEAQVTVEGAGEPSSPTYEEAEVLLFDLK
jgi:redox-sensitive bicupin YhaK (pirin superfamily)